MTDDGPFPHYPGKPDEIAGSVADLTGAATGFDRVGSAARSRARGASAHAEGDLRAPVAAVAGQVVAASAELRDAGRVAGGVLARFADAVIAFNRGVDDLNDRMPNKPTGTCTPDNPAGHPTEAAMDAFGAEKAALRAEYRRLEATLDDAGDEAAAMLDRGPNAADLAALDRTGHLAALDPSDDAALASALRKTGLGAERPLLNMSAADIARWWAGLSAAERAAMLRSMPEDLGRADGLPAEARDEANRDVLGAVLTRLRAAERDGTITDEQRQVLKNAEATQKQLDRIESTVDRNTLEPTHAQLYALDLDAFGGDGRAAIVSGDLDRARHVALSVPGLTSTLSGVAGQVTNSLNLYDAANSRDPGSTAVVTWMGYDAPSDSIGDFAGVTNQGKAEDGAGILARDVEGIRAARGDDQPHLTVVGHSYGSTTTALAGSDHGMDADDIVLVGSPGAGQSADDASDLGVGKDHVWVGSDSRDPVTKVGGSGWVDDGVGLGRDPSSDDFGANRFKAELPDIDAGLLDHHTSYFDKGSESLDNMTDVVAGDHDSVDSARHRHDPWYGPPEDPEEDRATAEIVNGAR